MRLICLLLALGLAACGGDDAGARDGGAGDAGIGQRCTCAAGSPNQCTSPSCNAGVTCFDPTHGGGVCTWPCRKLPYNQSDCPPGFLCAQSALDDYATGPWCFPN